MHKKSIYKKAFSPAELAVVIGVLTIVLAAATPIITKRAKVYPESTDLPIGSILLWNNSTSTSLPAGYYFCDGTNTTPNLGGRFIVGAGSSYPMNETGGEPTHTLTVDELPLHSHIVTIPSVAHSHSYSMSSTHYHSGYTASEYGNHTHYEGSYTLSGGSSSTSSSNYLAWGEWTVTTRYHSYNQYTSYAYGNHSHAYTTIASGAHTHTYTTSSAGGHGHTISLNSVGSGQPHNNLPLYHALCYIMKKY